jgi:GAF domain-containing protein
MKKAVHVIDAAEEEVKPRSAELAGARTHISVPLLKEDKLVGAIAIYRQKVQPFTDKQIELVENFAAQAVIAIENARLLNELRESLQQQTATADVLKVISSSTGELEPVFETMLANATQLCNAKFGTLNLYDGDVFRIMAVHNVPLAETRLHELIRPHPRGGHAQMVRTKEVVHIEDIRKGQAYLKGDPAVVAVSDLGGARTIVLVPMLKDDKLVGTINIYRQEVLPFTGKQIELVKNFAAQAVIAIENARLLNELRESLQQQTATADVLNIIASSPGELEPVFEAMLANATQICGAEFGLLYRSEGDMFRTVSLYGAPPAFAEQRRLNPMLRPSPGTALGRVAATKEMVQIPDVQAEPVYQNDPLRRASFLDLAGARTVVCVPMLKDNEVVGAISIYRQQVRPFTDKQIALLTNFAAQAVIAIENVRLLNELRESLQQQTATADVLKVISRSTFDLKTVLTTLVETAVRVCEADIGNIARPIDGDTYKIEANYGQSTALYEELARQTLKIGKGSVIGRTALNRAPVRPRLRVARGAKDRRLSHHARRTAGA